MSTEYEGTGVQVDVGSHWLLRIVAAIIDSIPWTIISWVIWRFLALSGSGAPLLGTLGGLAWLVWVLFVSIFYGLLFVIYSVAMESSTSAATLGKRIIGLKVQMLDGSKAPSNKVLTRNISKIFWPIFLIDFIIGIATPGPDPRQEIFRPIGRNYGNQCKASLCSSPTASMI